MTTEPTNPIPLTTIIEGLLFVAAEPVAINQLASAVECSVAEVEVSLATLKDTCQERGIRVQRQGQKVQLVSAPELAPYIENFLGLSISGKLSTPALETLAMVAYRQPITRPEIEAIRGVNSDGVLRTLISKGLVEEVGRLDTVGHPALFGTTFEFLRYFGLEDLKNLPPLELPADLEETVVDSDDNNGPENTIESTFAPSNGTQD
ncbi:MAG: SMC-Scp complex subunit ScpB [Anaerolineae bacterium]|nr:SMC-Scp complex subunit ScpB [Anaerolineae bacterium]